MSCHGKISRRMLPAAVMLGFSVLGSRGTLPAEPKKIPAGLSASEWNSIRGEYERNRRAAFRVGAEYRARNPEQQWLARFDGRGFVVEPDGAKWRWGLELVSYGFAGHERALKGPARVTVEKERVTYAWDRAVEEWFVNYQRGLEHGFTVKERPPGDGNRLAVQLAVRGGLVPRVQDDSHGVSFVDAEGHALVQYVGLKVLDANGKKLAARLETAGAGLRLEVEESGAHYPITIDPLIQQAYLKASNTDALDEFGGSVAVSGNTVVVGAFREASNATGVNGNQSDNSVPFAGAVYVFVRSGGVWSQQAYLKASNCCGSFGSSVAVSGDTVVGGAPGGSAAYVFARSGGSWSQQAHLKGFGDQFGSSVSVSGNTVVVGAPFSAVNAGAAYVFVRTAGVWTQQAYLKASNAEGGGNPDIYGDRFGISVAISGDTVVVGAYEEDSKSPGVNGDQSDNSSYQAGAAYVFVRSGGVWSQQAYLKASNPGEIDLFGYSVAVSDNTLVVGAYGEASNATGVNGNQNDDSKGLTGAAYVFVRSGAVWSQQAYLKASVIADYFGSSVAVSGDRVVVGAPPFGAAFVFLRRGGVWSQEAYLAYPPHAAFGASVAVSADTVVVGVPLEDSKLTPDNLDQSDRAGAAYVITTGIQAPPVANAGPNQTVECADPITLDGRGSSDRNFDPLTFVWTDPVAVIGSNAVLNLNLHRGTHRLRLTVDDGNNGQDSDEAIVTVRDTKRPVVKVKLTPNVLSLPDHRLVDVTAQLHIEDICDWRPKAKLVSIVSNEADSGLESGDMPNDIQGVTKGTDDRTFRLRAERSSKGSGRIYTVTYDVSDRAGNTARLTGEVKAPVKKP